MVFTKINDIRDLFSLKKHLKNQNIIGVNKEFMFYYLHGVTIEVISREKALELSGMNFDEFDKYIKSLLEIEEKD